MPIISGQLLPLQGTVINEPALPLDQQTTAQGGTGTGTGTGTGQMQGTTDQGWDQGGKKGWKSWGKGKRGSWWVNDRERRKRKDESQSYSEDEWR